MARSPDYQRDGITLYCGDALSVLGEIREGEIDLIVTDPPYGDTSLEWDKVFRQWPAMFLPTLAPHGSVWCFGSLRMFVEHAKDWQEFKLAQDLVWEKHNGSSSAADRFRRVHEHVAHFYPIHSPWNAIYNTSQVFDSLSMAIRFRFCTKRVRSSARCPKIAAGSSYTEHCWMAQ